MASNFCRNLLLPGELTEEQMADIPYPRAELIVHVTYKTLQAGCILGLAVGPALAILRGKTSQLREITARSMKIGALIGLPLGTVMTEGRLRSSNATEAAIYDRSYRIRYNRNQVRVDRGATYGLMAGAGFGFITGGSLLTAVLLGFNIGTVGGALYNSTMAHPMPPKVKGLQEKTKSTPSS